jgi:MoaA/NifB/PqqE/SkfB family radical SAM enzyme
MTGAIDKMPVLVLNPHNRCNCRCVMCDIWKRDSVEEISETQLEAQMESIERLGVEWLVLTGGEPLMHSRLFRLCEMIRARNIRLTLLSSGLLLERFAAEIVDHVDDVIVSLDGPPAIHDRIRRIDGAFARLQSGVGRIRTLRREFPVAARCTVQRENTAWLSDTVAAAHNLQLDSISFLAADLTSQAFNRQAGNAPDLVPDLVILREQIEKIVGAGECGAFVLESEAKLRRIVHHFAYASGGRPTTSPVCNAPWVSSVMEADGTVRPCFFHPAVGRVTADRTLFDVINGPVATWFRASLDVATNPICRRCVCSLNWQSSGAESGVSTRSGVSMPLPR